MYRFNRSALLRGLAAVSLAVVLGSMQLFVEQTTVSSAGTPIGVVSRAQAAEPSLLLDGSFEQPTVNGTTHWSYGAGQRFGAWLVVNGSVDVGSPELWLAADGRQSLDLNGYEAGTIAQSVTTVPGQEYLISYRIAGNVTCGDESAVMRLQVWWDDTLLGSSAFAVERRTRAAMGWQLETFRVTAAYDRSRLTLRSLSGGLCGPALDDVRVSAAAPATATPGISTTPTATVSTATPTATVPRRIDSEPDSLVLDGSFEALIVTGSSHRTLGAGSNIGAWRVSAGSVDLGGVSGWQSADGVQSLDLNGGDAGTISQLFTVSNGRTYQVSFALAAVNPSCSPLVRSVDVRWNGRSIGRASFDGSGRSDRNMGWTYHAFAVTAVDDRAELSFHSMNGGPCGPSLDHVRVIEDVAFTPGPRLPTATVPVSATPTTGPATQLNNGSFESPSVAAGNSHVTLSRGEAIGDWQIESGSVDLGGRDGWQSSDGHQSVDLNGWDAGAIGQTITTRPGTLYQITFAVAAANPLCRPTVRRVAVEWNGVQLGVAEFDGNGHSDAAMGWRTAAFNAMSNDSRARLTLRSLTGGSCGPTVDDVRVTENGSFTPTPPETTPTVPRPTLPPDDGTSLVRDGSFEAPIITGWSHRELYQGDSIGAWTVSAGSVDLGGIDGWGGAHGVQSLDLSGWSAGTISQRLRTESSRRYRISFAIASVNTICGPAIRSLQVIWQQTPVYRADFDGTGHSDQQMGWQYHRVDVVASDDQTELSFISLNAGPCGPALDDVRVTPLDGGNPSPTATAGPEVPIILNPSFEQPLVLDAVSRRLVAGDGLPGWQVAEGSVDLAAKQRWLTPDNGQSLELNGDDAGTVFQDLQTKVKSEYLIRFMFAGTPDDVCGTDSPRIKRLELRWDEEPVAILSFDVTGRSAAAMGWQEERITVSAQSPLSRLSLRSLTAGECGPVVDALRISAVNNPTPTPTPTEPPLSVELTGVTPDTIDASTKQTLTFSGSGWKGSRGLELLMYNDAVAVPLPAIVVVDERQVRAALPGGLPPGQYSFRLTTDFGEATLVNALTIRDGAALVLTALMPDVISNADSAEIKLSGSGFSADTTLFVGEQQVAAQLIHSELIIAIIPPSLSAGEYAVTAQQPDGTQSNPLTLTVIDGGSDDTDDLAVTAEEVWFAPADLRRGEPVTVGALVRRTAGAQTLDRVDVEFRLSDGTVLGRTVVEQLKPDSSSATVPLMVVFPDEGLFTLEVVVDADQVLPDTDRTNNLASVDVLVEPSSGDMAAPAVTELTVARSESARTVELTVRAADRGLRQSGLEALHLTEYVYFEHLKRWVSVAESGWLPATDGGLELHWVAGNQPGAHYLQVHARDHAGNISDGSGRLLVTVDDVTEQLPAGSRRLYQYPVSAGRSILTSADVLSGDVDLVVTFVGERFVRRISNRSGSLDEAVAFSANEIGAGIVQVEVHAVRNARYRLTSTTTASAMSSLAAPGTAAAPAIAANFTGTDLPDARLGASQPDLAAAPWLDVLYIPLAGR